MIPESEAGSSRIFGLIPRQLAPKLDTCHGFDLRVATPPLSVSRLDSC